MFIPDNVMYNRHVTYILVTLLALDGFANISIIEKGILPLSVNSVGIRLFVDIVNEDRNTTNKVISRVKKCCLYNTELEDCEDIDIYGRTAETIRPKDRKTFIYVYPTLHQHDLVGYCDIIYNGYKKRDKLQVRIPFDTRIRENNFDLKYYINQHKWKACETLDLDPLDNCSPVNCDVKYNGRKSYFDFKTNQCAKPLVCLEDLHNEVPSVIYSPESNACIGGEALLTVQDIYNINTGNTCRRSVKAEPKVDVKTDCSTISQHIYYLCDLINGNICPYSNKFRETTKSEICKVIMSVICVCAMIFSLLGCCHLSIWLHYRNYRFCNCVEQIKRKLRASPERSSSTSIKHLRNTLLRDVMYRDIPVEMRQSFIGICERIDKEVSQKKRYRTRDIGSQISLNRDRDDSSCSSRVYH